jgi:hypothetical protein
MFNSSVEKDLVYIKDGKQQTPPKCWYLPVYILRYPKALKES